MKVGPVRLTCRLPVGRYASAEAVCPATTINAIATAAVVACFTRKSLSRQAARDSALNAFLTNRATRAPAVLQHVFKSVTCNPVGHPALHSQREGAVSRSRGKHPHPGRAGFITEPGPVYGEETPIRSAISSEIAWRRRPTQTVNGPPKGARAKSLMRMPGTSDSFER
jgi:hypothetical protein